MKKDLNKGVTLIALIITIIVLLILAGITLAMVMGDNGILGKAGIAKDKTNDSQQAELNQLKDCEEQINTLGRGNTKKDGLYRFVDGNEGFTTTQGEVEFTSLGIKPKRYQDRYWKIEKTLNNPVRLNNKFEICMDLFMDNSNTWCYYYVFVELYKNVNGISEQVGRFQIYDCWGYESVANYSADFGNSSMNSDSSGTTWWSNNPGGRWSVLSDKSKLYIYRDNIKLLETAYSENLEFDKIVIGCHNLPEGSWQELPMLIKELYIGEPYYYKDILGE